MTFNLRKQVLLLLLLTSLGLTSRVSADDFVKPRYSCTEEFELRSFTGQKTFLEFMKDEVRPAMDRVANSLSGRIGNDDALESGKCVGVRIDGRNFTWHVNYPTDSEKGGRSYGKGPEGRVSDPSDKYYLDELEDAINDADAEELAEFYGALVEVIANCDATGFKKLENASQVVATDFLAIYVAEQKRRLISNLKRFKWDDALLQATMLAAFHSGQDNHKMFYEGRFTNQVYDQRLKAYKQSLKQAGKKTRTPRMRDYWQFSKNDPNRSGINLTRRDFEKLGKYITQFERRDPEGRELLEEIETRIRREKSDNIFKAIPEFFIRNDAPQNMSSFTPELSVAISKFLVRVSRDANDITKFIETNAWGSDNHADSDDNDD